MRKRMIVAGIAGLIALVAMLPVSCMTGDDSSCIERFAPMAGLFVETGPAADGIPPIDIPQFDSVDRTNLSGDDMVLGVNLPGHVAAYPLDVMTWHEIVNLSVDGRRASVTWCPLTGSAIGFWDHGFGSTGQVFNNNMVMYDRATGSRVPQMLGQAVDGPDCGERPATFPVVRTTWARWRALHPDSEVLSRRTGFDRGYDTSPYGNYAETGTIIYPVTAVGRALPAKTVVVCLENEGDYLAVERDGFAGRHPAGLRVELGGRELRLVWDEALGTVGTEVPVRRFEAYWFAWYALHPQTRLDGGRGAAQGAQ